MDFFKKLGKIVKIRFYITMIIVGLLFSVIAGIIILQPSVETVEAEATIRLISFDGTDLNGDSQYTVFIDFTDRDGVLHEGVRYPGYSSSMETGKTVTIEYNPDNPTEINPAGGDFIPYVFFAIGIICIVYGVLMIVKSAKSHDDEMGGMGLVDNSKVSKETLDAIRNNNEPMNLYYFHWAKKLNQSYVLEKQSDRTAVYEANCDRISAFRPYVYTFNNLKTGTSSTHEITHTVTTRYGSKSGNYSFSLPTSSKFKVDGEICWNVLAKNGYSFDMNLEGLKMNFEVYHYGLKVASFETAGTNILKDDATSRLGEMPTNGLYRVECRDTDLEMVFFACFCASRVEFF